ncbi:MAG: T9SS type A sorting domain-containing protein [Bacteroidota bacterium]|nr:T9SS type A sorting domain-containing protein [Bacteroidota bacterium]MDP4231912.1 T9SS type A sorting domain-containing protein [Bacteroidota bacterium]MDP4241381.1 T9SS type A sorting domain-containing protein [Bacteroidota bacterium]MDP4287304.1 T9SS type A sorting domain-containing protein [Bacteroidota bacterium]
MFRYFFASALVVLSLMPLSSQAQKKLSALSVDCPPGKQYPFVYCPGAIIRCSACPKDDAEPGEKVNAPGLPTSVCVDDRRTTSSSVAMYVINNGPCASNKIAKVFDPVYMNEDAHNALSNWSGICDPDPASPCCWHIILTDDASFIQADGRTPGGDNPTPAYTIHNYDHDDCILSCDAQYTVLNFCQDFMSPSVVFDNDPSGDPCDFSVMTTSFYNPELASNIIHPQPSDGQVGNYFLNVTDVLTHELGHYLGYPDENLLTNSGLPCAPYTAADGIMYGINNWDDLKTPSSVGLPTGDPVRCWFKLLYCSSCTLSVASGHSSPDGLGIIDLQPNPTTARLTLTYTLSKSSVVAIAVYDLLGNQVGSQIMSRAAAGLNSASIDIGGSVAEGVYYLRLSSDVSVTSMKFVKAAK